MLDEDAKKIKKIPIKLITGAPPLYGKGPFM